MSLQVHVAYTCVRISVDEFSDAKFPGKGDKCTHSFDICCKITVHQSCAIPQITRMNKSACFQISFWIQHGIKVRPSEGWTWCLGVSVNCISLSMNGAVSPSAQGHSCVLSVHLLCLPFLYFDPMIIAHQGPLSMEFSRQEYQSGLPVGSSGSPGSSQARDWTPISLSSALPGRFFTTEPPGKPFSVWVLVIYWFRRVFIY